MSSITSRVMIILLAFLTGMPAGWCCVPASSESAQNLNGVAACCRHQLPQSPTDERPAAPHSECCCIHDATVPADSAELVGSLTDAAFDAPNWDELRPRLDRPRSTDHFLFQAGPRSHVLQCVWLC